MKARTVTLVLALLLGAGCATTGPVVSEHTSIGDVKVKLRSSGEDTKIIFKLDGWVFGVDCPM